MSASILVLGLFVFLILPLAAGIWVLSCIVRETRRDRVPILLYHRLVARSDVARGAVPDDEMIWVSYDDVFGRQMDYLARAGFTTLDLDDYLAIREGGRELPQKPVIVTFDDGYESNYTLAYPALRRNGQKAVIFVAPEPDAYTRNLVAGIDGFLTDEQMREMSDHGVSIQSHSLTHALLTDLADPEIERELVLSRERLAGVTGRPVLHLAIPRGGYSRTIRRIARETGYRTVCCNNKGSASGFSDLLALPRIVIERDMDEVQFARSLTPARGVMLRVFGNLKRVPERIGGPRFARRVRGHLYRSPLRGMFKTASLRRVVSVGGLLYVVLAAGFWIRFAGL